MRGSWFGFGGGLLGRKSESSWTLRYDVEAGSPLYAEASHCCLLALGKNPKSRCPCCYSHSYFYCSGFSGCPPLSGRFSKLSAPCWGLLELNVWGSGALMESASPNATWGPFIGKARSILSWHPPGLEYITHYRGLDNHNRVWGTLYHNCNKEPPNMVMSHRQMPGSLCAVVLNPEAEAWWSVLRIYPCMRGSILPVLLNRVVL